MIEAISILLNILASWILIAFAAFAIGACMDVLMNWHSNILENIVAVTLFLCLGCGAMFLLFSLWEVV